MVLKQPVWFYASSILVVFATPTEAALAATITPHEAASHIGQVATVEGTASVYTTKSGVTFVDLGGYGRSSPFTGVIFKDNAGKFPNVNVLSGKVVDIHGRIKEYRGKPEIILNNAGQLTPK